MKIGLHPLLSECHKILFLHVDSCIMCIDIYVYSCLKLLSNRPEDFLNPCSNHEICVPFEHGFSGENAHYGAYFVSAMLTCFPSLPFSKICK